MSNPHKFLDRAAMEDEFTIWAAESGRDRELDFNPEVDEETWLEHNAPWLGIAVNAAQWAVGADVTDQVNPTAHMSFTWSGPAQQYTSTLDLPWETLKSTVSLVIARPILNDFVTKTGAELTPDAVAVGLDAIAQMIEKVAVL